MTHDEDQAVWRELIGPVRKWGPRLARAITVLVLVFGVVAYRFGERLESVVSSQAHLIGVLEERQVLGCHRTNIERRVANLQNYADYKFFSFTYTVIKTAAEHPARPPTATERKITKAFIAGLGHDIALKAYVPLTFCTAAAKHNLAKLYQPPTPVTFVSVGGRAPSTAFRLQKGQ